MLGFCSPRSQAGYDSEFNIPESCLSTVRNEYFGSSISKDNLARVQEISDESYFYGKLVVAEPSAIPAIESPKILIVDD